MNFVFPQHSSTFESFYADYRPLVYTIALRMLHDRHDADDVTQAVFLKILQRPELFRGGNVESWLTTLSKNRAIDTLRRRDRLRVLDDFCLPVVAVITVEDEVLASLESLALVRAVGELPECQRLAVLASFWQGQSHEQIAAVTRLPLGTVKTRIRGGIKRLRRKVKSDVLLDQVRSRHGTRAQAYA